MLNHLNNGLVAVRDVANSLGFDVWWCVPGKYFVVCDWYLNISRMFDDNERGSQEAIKWMHAEKDDVLAKR